MDLISLQSSWESLLELFSGYNMSEKDLLFLRKKILEEEDYFPKDTLILNTILPGEYYGFTYHYSKTKTIIVIGENGERVIPKSAFENTYSISTIGSEQYPITKIEEHGFYNGSGGGPMEIFLDSKVGATLEWSALDTYGHINIHGQIKYMGWHCLGSQYVTFIDKQTKLEYIGKEVFGGNIGYFGPSDHYFYIPNTIQTIKEKALVSGLKTIEFASTDLTNVTIEDMNAFPLTNTDFKFIVPHGTTSTYITKFNSITDSKGTWTALSQEEKEALFEEANAE